MGSDEKTLGQANNLHTTHTLLHTIYVYVHNIRGKVKGQTKAGCEQVSILITGSVKRICFGRCWEYINKEEGE